MKKPNKFAHMADGTVIVMLERRDGTVFACRIDAADWEKVRGHRWYAQPSCRTSYAIAKRKEGRNWISFTMHRLLLPECEEVDHEDGNGLNNKRANLRNATRIQNARNRRKPLRNNKGISVASKFKGVYWNKQRSKWEAHIKINGSRHYIGLFSSEQDAARGYDVVALRHHGEFAKLNFAMERAA